MIDRLHYISQETPDRNHLDVIRDACQAGCRWIQLRMKETPAEEMHQIALEAKTICKEFTAKLIINDHVEIAHQVEADGVHLGQNDMDPLEARQLLGDDFIIGGTANTYTHMIWLADAQVDYIGLGPFRFTTTKKELSPVLGVQGYAELIQKIRMSKIRIPIIAIGGILEDDLEPLLNVGVHGIAVSGLITNSLEKAALVTRLYNKLS